MKVHEKTYEVFAVFSFYKIETQIWKCSSFFKRTFHYFVIVRFYINKIKKQWNINLFYGPVSLFSMQMFHTTQHRRKYWTENITKDFIFQIYKTVGYSAG